MIGIKDFLNYQSLCQLELSPNGRFAAFVVQQPDLKNNNYTKALWLSDLETGECYKLLDGSQFLGHFSWEDDGHIFYLARGTQGKTWCRRYYVETLVDDETCIIPEATDWVWPMGNRYIFRKEEQLIQEEYPEEIGFLKDYEEGFETIDEIPLWNNGEGFVSGKRIALYSMSSNGGKVKKLTHDHTTVDSVYPRPEGLYFTGRTYRGRNTEPGIYFLASDSDTPVKLVEEGRYRIANFGAGENPDTGKIQVYFMAQDKTVNCMTDDFNFYTVEDGAVVQLPIPATSVGDAVHADGIFGDQPTFRVEHGCFYYISSNEWSSVVKKTDFAGHTETLTPEGGSVTGFWLRGDGSICYIGLRDTKLQELYLCKDGALKQLTKLNEDRLDQEQVIQPETFTFENHGFRVNYVVLPPANFDPSKTYPGIFYIHGGAKVIYTKVFFHEMQYLASQGYFVIYGNPHGSEGQGSDFARLLGHYGEPDFEDMMLALDKALELYPNLDPERLGVAGGSYGGIMTNWTVTHTDRFKCGVAQRSICNMISTFGTADNGFNFVKEQMDGDLWDGFENLWRQSPLKYANQCHTPLLLIHSDEDYRCHYSEAIEMFTALKYLGVESKVCLIRGENHSLSRCGRPVQRIKRLYEICHWFDIHLKG